MALILSFNLRLLLYFFTCQVECFQMNYLLQQFIRPPKMRYNLKFLFSVSKDPKTEKHEAILASNIIEKIIESSKDSTGLSRYSKNQQKKGFSYTSLRSEIIELINRYENQQKIQSSEKPSTQPQLSIQTAKKNIMDFFDGGVWIDNQLCKQDRFLSEQLISKYPDQSLKHKKISFCPTYTVTAPIFNLIIDKNETTSVTGHYGIGKTYSFLLYHLLSDIIYRYLHNYDKQKQRKIDGKIVYLPKLIYWSINPNLFQGQFNQKKINDLIAKQCYQLTEHHPNYNFVDGYAKGQTNAIYFFRDYGIHIRIAIDQIEFVASKIRINQNLYKKRKNLEWKNSCMKDRIEGLKDQKQKKDLKQQIEKNKQQIQKIKQQQQELEPQFERAQKILKIARTLRNRFSIGFFITPRYFQGNQSVNLDLNGQGSHTFMSCEKINMQQNQTDYLYCDLTELFGVLLQNRCKLKNKSELTENQKNLIKKIKETLFEKLRKKKMFIMPLKMTYELFDYQYRHMREIIQIIDEIIESKQPKPYPIKTIKQDKSVEYLSLQSLISGKIDGILSNIEEKSKVELQDLIDTCLNQYEYEIDQQKLIQKKIMFVKLLYDIKSKILQKRLNPFVTSKQIKILLEDIFHMNTNVQKYQIQKSIDQKLASYNDGRKIIFTVNQQIIYQTLKKKQKSLLQALHEKKINIYKMIESYSASNSYFQSLIVNGLSQKDMVLKIRAFYQLNDYVIQQVPSTTSDQELYFNPIPHASSSRYGQFRFLKAFEEVIKIKKQGRYLYLPKKQEFDSSHPLSRITQQKKYHQSSKKMDFALTYLGYDRVEIRVFDAIILEEGQAKLKFFDFIYEFSNFIDRQQQKIQGFYRQIDVYLHYSLLVPKIRDYKIDWKEIIDQVINRLQKDLGNEKKKQQKLKTDTDGENKEALKEQKQKKEKQLQSIRKTMTKLQERKRFLQKLIQTQGNSSFQGQKKSQGKQTNKLMTYKNITINGRCLSIKRSPELKTLLPYSQKLQSINPILIIILLLNIYIPTNQLINLNFITNQL